MLLGRHVGRLCDRAGTRAPIVTGMLVCACASLWLARLDGASGDGVLLFGLLVLGIGIALVQTPMTTVAMNSVPPAALGVASGTLSATRMLGATAGVACAGVFVTASGTTIVSALQTVFSISAVAALLGAAAGARLLASNGRAPSAATRPSPSRTSA